MSLEVFCQTHPATLELKGIMEDKKARDGHSCRSLIGLLALDISQAGGEGMRELTRRFSHSEVAMSFDSDSFRAIDPEIRDALISHHAAVVFGISVVNIEDILCEGVFDMRQWRDRYNIAISGTPFRGEFPEVGTKGKDVERLTKEQQNTLISCASQDKTLVIFFNEGRKSLPVGLKSILEQPGRLRQIRASVLPIYSERARFLVG